ncbi:CheR family methyltransferase [Paraburkholderia sp. BCC1886]|uniref:CheR family methyltransferase n=1 Tax=Paraburkholderia sp. BCC1886 TaxID=2562670 RepID=UPI001183C1FD|nr:protein-glutamate O-methyltransferase CheR [Paraburkholderia sp. BCC1886]
MNAHHDNAPLYRRFADLLHRTMGLDAASLGHSAIERAVDQRAAAWRADGHDDAPLAAYWEATQASPAMVQALVETVVVPETWFFRDADAFKALARLARVTAARRGGSLPLRILSLPCSSGEEPYTIAMTLFDAGFAATEFRIDAMDISERSLALARRAIYGRNSFRGNALAFRDAHFARVEAGWRLAPRIVDAVRFSRANLMQLDASALGVYDFVFCRNVLIYFDREAQHAALQALESVLAEDGTLFVGPSETGLLVRHGLQSAKIPLAFAFYRAASVDANRETPPHLSPTAPLANAAASAMTRWPQSTLAPVQVFSAQPFAWPDAVARAPLDRATAAAEPMIADTARPASRTAPTAPTPGASSATPTDAPTAAPTNAARDTLQAAQALADAGRLAEAATALTAYLERHAPHADAFYLLGVLADAHGETNLARGHYRKALYLDPQHGEALAHLATLLELEGDRAGARLLLQRASRAQGASRG